jgi:hypothetical protein
MSRKKFNIRIQESGDRIKAGLAILTSEFYILNPAFLCFAVARMVMELSACRGRDEK